MQLKFDETSRKSIDMDGRSSDDAPDDSVTCGTKYHPINFANTAGQLQNVVEGWVTVLGTHCTFPPEVFHGVMLNLIKNPNVTSSHLFRADIFYDGGELEDGAHSPDGQHFRHLKAEYRPINASLPDYEVKRTIVRQLIPRNPQLDKPLVQTCHFFQRLNETEEGNIVLYIPHVEQADDIPFYHPAVSQLAFTHTWQPSSEDTTKAPGTISVSYRLFPETALTTKLERTAMRLLQTVHKHGQGQLAGYEKRVHHDQIIPQKRYQDTYTRLKTKYGRQLSEQWVEVTDPGKHVFEDIGIAAFLIELWRDMYARPSQTDQEPGCAIDAESEKPSFPGFVDIGCGNGLLVYLLLSEGYQGWGFDARQRKTWSTFPEDIQQHLRQCLLVPEVLFDGTDTPARSELFHNGTFGPGTFIVSNHADELTAWTPLLAYLNDSAFIAIPCCSHDLTGARFRAPLTTKAARTVPARLPQQKVQSLGSTQTCSNSGSKHAAETGSLNRSEAQKKMPSAYSTLCSYVSSLTEEVSYVAEKEVLRIPSTRNQCIVGRRRQQQLLGAEGGEDLDSRRRRIVEVVESELGRSITAVGGEWVERAQKLAKKPGSGH